MFCNSGFIVCSTRMRLSRSASFLIFASISRPPSAIATTRDPRDHRGYAELRFRIDFSQFGGMVACELAAAYPQRVRRLALIDPIGLWRDTDPIVNWVKLSPAELPNYIFRNPAVEAAQQLLGPSEPPDAAIAARVRLMWAMGATSKFIWPIPDKGLKKRIHRVSAPTLIVWGADDRLVPSVYADEFSKRLARARVHIITGAGHAHRSAGRPEAIFVIERLIDLAADQLKLDPVELRRKNMIPPAAQPYTNPLGITY